MWAGVWGGLQGKEALCAGTEATVTGKGTFTRAWGRGGAWCEHVRLQVLVLNLFWEMSLYLCWGEGEGNDAGNFLVPGGVSPWMLFLEQDMKWANLHCVLQALFRMLFPCYMSVLFACLLLKSKTNVLCALSHLNPLIFKTPGFEPHWLQELTKFDPSHFPMPLLSGSIFPICSSVW